MEVKWMLSSGSGAVVAKIKSIYGKKIQKDQLIELSNCKSVSSIASYLKSNTHYCKILKNINENTIHRGQLENFLRQQNFNNYQKIYRYLNKQNKTFFKLTIEEFELLEILKAILLLKANNIKQYITNLPGYLISKCNVDLLGLAKIENFDNLLALLKHTQYYKPLSKLKPTSEQTNIDYSACEYELFKQFFNKTFRTIEQNINKTEQNDLKKLINLQIDHLNICRIYRERIIFNKNREKIIEKIFPFHKVLNESSTNYLIDSKSSEEFNSKLKELFKINKNIKNIFSGNYIENFMHKLDYKDCKRLIHLSNSFSVVFYAFHKLSQIEISNLIYAIEGVRYGMLAKEIQKLYII